MSNSTFIWWCVWLSNAQQVIAPSKWFGPLGPSEYEDIYEPSWIIEMRFIVIDANNMVYPFLVSNDTMNKWEDKYKTILTHCTYHYNNKVYDLPYEFATGKITL